MIQLDKILVPTDFSKGSNVAYEYASDFAKKFNGKVDLLHVIPSLKYFDSSIKKLVIPLDLDKDLYPQLTKEMRTKLEQDLNTKVAEQQRGRAMVMIDRKPSDAIIQRAKDEKYDMVIMGANGIHLSKLIRGSTTERVLRYSDVPVLSVPEHLPSRKVRKLLVPVDFSQTSLTCLPFAVSLAAAIGGELTLYHVLEIHGSVSENIPREPGKTEEQSLYEYLIAQVNAYLKKHKGIDAHIEKLALQIHDVMHVHHQGEHHQVKLHVKINKAVSAHHDIIEYAQDHCDMIIMTTHGKGGLTHLFLGSTTERVALNAGVPVVTFRPGKKKSS